METKTFEGLYQVYLNTKTHEIFKAIYFTPRLIYPHIPNIIHSSKNDQFTIVNNETKVALSEGDYLVPVEDDDFEGEWAKVEPIGWGCAHWVELHRQDRIDKYVHPDTFRDNLIRDFPELKESVDTLGLLHTTLLLIRSQKEMNAFYKAQLEKINTALLKVKKSLKNPTKE